MKYLYSKQLSDKSFEYFVLNTISVIEVIEFYYNFNFAGLWLKKLTEYQERFDKLDSMKVKEEFRPFPVKNDDLLGYHGNFKKLEVD